MSSEDDASFEDRFSDQARKKALEMFEHRPVPAAEEFDFGELFTRILGKRLDRQARISRHQDPKLVPRPQHDTKLSKELKALIPDMREVAKAYDEMTTGYKEFIQSVLDAKQSSSPDKKED